MLALLFYLMQLLVSILPWVMMAGWIVGMADPSGSWAITRVLNGLCGPYLRLVSGMIPRIGMLDISPMLIFALGFVVRLLLVQLYP